MHREEKRCDLFLDVKTMFLCVRLSPRSCDLPLFLLALKPIHPQGNLNMYIISCLFNHLLPQTRQLGLLTEPDTNPTMLQSKQRVFAFVKINDKIRSKGDNL